MRDDNKFHREKRYVEVDVRFTPDGKIRPLAINYDKSVVTGDLTSIFETSLIAYGESDNSFSNCLVASSASFF